MNNLFKIFLIFLFTLCLSKAGYSQESNCLYKNPLCFYNTDILNYLQVLHKNQQYSKMTNFLYGPNIHGKDKNTIEESLSNASFGYSLKRVGIKEKNKTSWSLNAERPESKFLSVKRGASRKQIPISNPFSAPASRKRGNATDSSRV